MTETKSAQYVGVGELLPDITLPRLGGGDLSLASLRGKFVLLYMWASW